MHAGTLVQELMSQVERVMDRTKDEYLNAAMTELGFACKFEALTWKDQQLVEWLAAVRKEQSNGRTR